MTCDVCSRTLKDSDDVIGGKLRLPAIWVYPHKVTHAHLGCYRLLGEYNRITARKGKRL